VPDDGLPRDESFLIDLTASLQQDPDVLGLVLAGSSADAARRDRWSDHDFLVITRDGEQERYRTHLGWLPDSADIAWSFRETAHGLKALYRDGLVVEFAVFDMAEFAGCALNHYRVAIDRGGVAELAASVSERSLGGVGVDPLVEFRHFLSLLHIGTGRARRGELLSANVMLRDHATAHLLRLVRFLLAATDPAALATLDALDPWRRFEHAAPALAAQIDAALTRPVGEVAAALLRAADPFLRDRWPGYPRQDTEHLLALLDPRAEGLP
jgi:hypothetical protein